MCWCRVGFGSDKIGPQHLILNIFIVIPSLPYISEEKRTITTRWVNRFFFFSERYRYWRFRWFDQPARPAIGLEIFISPCSFNCPSFLWSEFALFFVRAVHYRYRYFPLQGFALVCCALSVWLLAISGITAFGPNSVNQLRVSSNVIHIVIRIRKHFHNADSDPHSLIYKDASCTDIRLVGRRYF